MLRATLYMANKRNHEFTDIERRLLRANGQLAAELRRRGIASRPVKQQPSLTGALFAAELANTDCQLAARAVLRGLLSREELKALDTMLRFQPRGACAGKLDELIRIVERKLEGKRCGNGH
ncbi:MAG: hypothetical protein ACRD2P_04655 [Terriglobia bacterium]